MRALPRDARPRAARATARVTADGLVSAGLFLAAFLFFFVSIDPFVDLTDPAVLLPAAGSNTLNQAAVLGLALGLVLYVACTDTSRFGLLLTWPVILLFAWLALTVLVSADPSQSARRLVLTGIVFGIAATVLVLPRDVERFADLIAAAALLVLAISYGGVLLVPKYAIHQAGELLEPEHAGHWRGPFTHKNGAGAAMVLCLFMGLYVARRRSAALGWLIALASGVFLVRSMAKTSIAMVLPSLLLAWLTVSVRATFVRFLIVPGALGLLTVFTIGSVLVPAIGAFNASTMSDPTFTNRTDIWGYALGNIMAKPFTGHGFETFWGSESVFFGESSNWANRATDSHNGYLDTLLGAGIPGLCLVLWLFVVAPLRDLARSETSGNDPATTLFFVRIWAFCTVYAGLESFFFSNGGPVWFMYLLALFGLRFQARAQGLTRHDTGRAP